MKKTKILVLSLLSVLTIGGLAGCANKTNSGGSGGPVTTSQGGGDEEENEIITLEMKAVSVGYDKDSQTVTATFSRVTGAARYELEIFKSTGVAVENSKISDYESGTPIDVSGYETGTYILKVRAISSDTTKYTDSRWRSGDRSFTISRPNRQEQLQITNVEFSFTRNSNDTATVTALYNELPSGVTTTVRIYKITDSGNVKVDEKVGYLSGSAFRTKVLDIGRYKASVQANGRRNVTTSTGEVVDYTESAEVMGTEELVIDAAPVVKPTVNLTISSSTVEKVEEDYVFSWVCDNPYNGICYEVTIKDSNQIQVFKNSEVTSSSVVLTEANYPAGEYYFSVKALGTDRLSSATYVDSEEVTIQRTLVYEHGGGETPVDPPVVTKEIEFVVDSWTEENGLLTINVSKAENVEKISFLIKDDATNETVIQEETTEIKSVYTFDTSSFVKDRRYRCTILAKNETEDLTRVREYFEFTHTADDSVFDLEIISLEQYTVSEGVKFEIYVNTNDNYLTYSLKIEQNGVTLLERLYYNDDVDEDGVCISDEFFISGTVSVAANSEVKITVTAIPEDASLPREVVTRQCTVNPEEESFVRHDASELDIQFEGLESGYYTILGNSRRGLKIQFSVNALTISEVNSNLEVRAGTYNFVSLREYNTGRFVFEYAYTGETEISVEIEVDDLNSFLLIGGVEYEYYGTTAPAEEVVPDYPLTLNGDVKIITTLYYEIRNGKFDMHYTVDDDYYNRGYIDSSDYANNTISLRNDVFELEEGTWDTAFVQKDSTYCNTQAGKEEQISVYGFNLMKALKTLKRTLNLTNSGVANTNDDEFVAFEDYIDAYDSQYIDAHGQTHNAEIAVYAMWLPNSDSVLFVLEADEEEFAVITVTTNI